MPTRVDGRPYQIDCLANPDRDGPTLIISGFPSGYLDSVTVSAPITEVDGTATTTSWTAAAAATTITLSLPQADVGALGDGSYKWTLLATLSGGDKPALIGGSLLVGRQFNPRASSGGEVSVSSAAAEVALTFTQVLSGSATAIDGGTPSGSGSEDVDGGTP